MSHRPALKALAGHAETQAEEMGLEIQADTQCGGAVAHCSYWLLKASTLTDTRIFGSTHLI